MEEGYKALKRIGLSDAQIKKFEAAPGSKSVHDALKDAGATPVQLEKGEEELQKLMGVKGGR